MQFVIFILGVILGSILRDIKLKVYSGVSTVKKVINSQEKVKFIDSIPFKEKFDNSDNITDLLDE